MLVSGDMGADEFGDGFGLSGFELEEHALFEDGGALVFRKGGEACGGGCGIGGDEGLDEGGLEHLAGAVVSIEGFALEGAGGDLLVHPCGGGGGVFDAPLFEGAGELPADHAVALAEAGGEAGEGGLGVFFCEDAGEGCFELSFEGFGEVEGLDFIEAC